MSASIESTNAVNPSPVNSACAVSTCLARSASRSSRYRLSRLAARAIMLSRRSVTLVGDDGCAPIADTTAATRAVGPRAVSWSAIRDATASMRSADETQVPPNLWT